MLALVYTGATDPWSMMPVPEVIEPTGSVRVCVYCT